MARLERQGVYYFSPIPEDAKSHKLNNAAPHLFSKCQVNAPALITAELNKSSATIQYINPDCCMYGKNQQNNTSAKKPIIKTPLICCSARNLAIRAPAFGQFRRT